MIIASQTAGTMYTFDCLLKYLQRPIKENYYRYPVDFYGQVGRFILVVLTVSLFNKNGFGQQNQTVLPPCITSASWISHPQAGKHAFGIFHFRKSIVFKKKPEKYIINISGDQRFRLFVNGISVAIGPARSDVQHWRYQPVDIAPFLLPGKNILAAVVWNDGENSAWAQMSYQTGFLIFGASEKECAANTDSSWKVIENLSYTPLASVAHITGAFDQVFAQRYPWGWQNLNYDDSHWLVPAISEKVVFNLSQIVSSASSGGRMITVNKLPMPEETLQRIDTIRRSTGLDSITNNFLKGTGILSVHPWANAEILLDQKYLTTAFIKMLVSGGAGAKITITYAESLFDKYGNKGNRNEIESKFIKGDQDVFIADGGTDRLFTTLYYRTYRYVLLHIENHQEPLEIKDFYGLFTAYPFQLNASFVCNDTTVNNIWNTGWKTARLCAYETYMDCPYYEQLQYVGDTRIQALVSLYLSGDDRLMKNAIEQIEYSMLPEGITQSRYPSSNLQIIPPFSLFWIGMVHDYWMHKPGDEFVKSKISCVKKIIDWYQRHVDSEGLLGKTPYWNFVDWPKEWPWTGSENESGIPSGTKEGISSILSLQYVMALQKASDLMKAFGYHSEASAYAENALSMRNTVYKNFWDSSRQYMADIPQKNIYSQHAQALTILTGTVENEQARQLLNRTLNDPSLIQCTYYYRFYLLQALRKTGLENEYLNNLAPWKQMLALGLTTFAEAPEPSRSDCHAWSSSPCYDLLATVCGITPASPGFKTIQIKPAPGDLKYFKASMPHPEGIIEITYQRLNDKMGEFNIQIPANTSGIFIWENTRIKLTNGSNHFIIQNRIEARRVIAGL